MAVRLSRASAVVVQKVPAADVNWFLDWQRDVTETAETFPGYSGTEVFPPTRGQGDEWVSLIHFEDESALDAWLESPARNQRIEMLKTKVGAFELKTVQGGFGPWFASMGSDSKAGPPAWKMVLTVLLGLYPTVMLLTMFVGPFTSPLGMAVSMLIGNALSVSILQWAVMPILTPALARWLNASGDRQKQVTLKGLGLVLVLLAVMTLLFHMIMG
ncbi:antibiotic biosynthesis monooxygenase [Singulisphaera sp. Ch08]|uniref:Antibiotic biosynthesis monooxygenase n=1 Tax=Singulisphaera sp. Ch08 TaxID=3120278 RepID=A0AAU7CKM8_9BACT